MQVHWRQGNPPQTPFYAVIFLSRKRERHDGYAEMDERLMREVQDQAGFLGYSSSGGTESTFISYWQDEASIAAWQAHPIHREAKKRAAEWYQYYHSMISKVEHYRSFEGDHKTIEDCKR